MKSYGNFLFLFILTIISNGLHAQANETSISGYVYNPDHEPAMYSTVMLMNRDTVLVKGAFSQEDGSFVFERIDPGEYYIQVRNVEFKTYLSDMISVRQNDQYILDYIVLSPASIDLGEVVVTADKALLEIHPDKMVYNVSASVNASGSSGLELLGKAPGVTVDMDNNINLQGKSGVLIYIYSPWIWRGSVEAEGNHGLEVGVRKAFLNRMLILQLTGSDVFRTNSDYFYQSNYGGIVTDGVRTFDNQRFGFSLNWNFGNQQAKARQRNRSAIDDEMRRISE